MSPAVGLALIPLLAHALSAQECTSVPLTEIGSLHGRTISALTVTTSPPDKMPGPAGALEVLHVRTAEATIRRQFLVHQGEPFDTLRTIESMHRLKRQSYLAD